MPPSLPAWCEWRRGPGRLLIVAPHGGRRPLGEAGTPRKVNDLHTVDLARELADRTGASLVANAKLDRNVVDLNRLTQTARHAPWLFELYAELIEECLRRHGLAEVLVIHGWNVVQPKCDLGIGAPLVGVESAWAQHARLTVSPWYVRQRLEPWRAACAASGIAAAYGERYPASHPNNLLQLFRRHRVTPRLPGAAARLADLAREGRVQATQLELAVPLRWPGPLRDRFVALTARAFAEDPPPAGVVPQALPPSPAGVHALALQCYDPRSDIGVMTAVSSTPRHALGGRLLVFLGGQRIALFTGEDPPAHGTVFAGPQFTSHADGFSIGFDGHVLVLDDAALYADLEHALARSSLGHLRVALRFRHVPSPWYGAVTGTIDTATGHHRIDTYGFTDGPLARRGVPGELSVTAGFGAHLGVRIYADRAGATAIDQSHATAPAHAIDAPEIHLAQASGVPTRIAATMPRGVLTAEPLNRMIITRAGSGGHPVRTTFGVARCALTSHAEGFGFYEHTTRY